jgi:hypothetical protein
MIRNQRKALKVLDLERATEIKDQLKKTAISNSEGDWESLTYCILDAAKLRNFIALIVEEGNYIKCSQESVNYIENILKEHKTYSNWESKNKEMVEDDLGRGFLYLFSTLNSHED